MAQAARQLAGVVFDITIMHRDDSRPILTGEGQSGAEPHVAALAGNGRGVPGLLEPCLHLQHGRGVGLEKNRFLRQSGKSLPSGARMRAIGSIKADDDALDPGGSGEFPDNPGEGSGAYLAEMTGQDQGHRAMLHQPW